MGDNALPTRDDPFLLRDGRFLRTDDSFSDADSLQINPDPSLEQTAGLIPVRDGKQLYTDSLQFIAAPPQLTRDNRQINPDRLQLDANDLLLAATRQGGARLLTSLLARTLAPPTV